MKLTGTKMFGVVVGSPSLNPIKAVTNTEEYNGTNFKTAGFMQTKTYDSLKNDIAKIAADLCGSSVTITKQVRENANSVPGSNWSFDTTVTIPGANGKWVLPNISPTGINAGVPSTKTLLTGADGKATFKWQPLGGQFNTGPVVVKETVLSGAMSANPSSSARRRMWAPVE